MSRDSKVMTAAQAVSAFVKDGDCLTFGGFVTNRRAYALVREIIRQGRKNLYVESGGGGGDIDLLVGAGRVGVFINSYMANSGYSMVCRRYREAVEKGTLLYDDYSLDVQTIVFHGAALGLPYMPVKNMLASDLINKWGISEERRRAHPKLPDKKFVIQENPFQPGEILCLAPTPSIDVALIHVQTASPDGTCRIEGPQFQDVDIAVAARRTIVSCEELISDEEMRASPDRNTLPGLCVDAVTRLPFGAHPAQCFNHYDYDPALLWEYEEASRDQAGFDGFLTKYVLSRADHEQYLAFVGQERLEALRIKDRAVGYVAGLRRGRPQAVAAEEKRPS
ncbi:MAG: glutaconate CoA-transferase [Candidatus Adiutrix sp.]|jgi:glutaconate CoA-transferase subunit A|nr:glutaconate CoA-transferase [Candidatus Adiutrix sp.]